MSNLIDSFKSRFMDTTSTKPFKVFLVLIAIEISYVVAKDFSIGFWRGALTIAGN